MVGNVFGFSFQGGGEYIARLLPHPVTAFYQSQSSCQGFISMLFSLLASGSAPSSELLLDSP